MQKVSSIHTFGSTKYDLHARTHIMGILNVTPDSFSDGGRYFDVEQAFRHAIAMADEGADFIDIGGESTRPGADPLPIEEELNRVLPVIERLVRASTVPISIDTYKSTVAERALNAGAVIVNDISGLHFDSELATVAAKHRASIILMHIKGTPKTMQLNPEYDDVIEEICSYLAEGKAIAARAGIEQIIVDPGIGFGKTIAHNLEIIRRLKELGKLECPILVGPSRKSFIGTLLDVPVEERMEGTAAAVAVSVMNGASIVRVHDVKQMKRVATMVDAILKS